MNLVSSVDHAYAVGGAFMVAPSTFNYFLTQKDSVGRPYYSDFDPETGLMRIANKLVYINNAMPVYNPSSPTASSPIALFGDFSRAYAYLNGGGVKIRILRERFIADTLEQYALIYHRLGAAKLVSGAVKALVTAAS